MPKSRQAHWHFCMPANSTKIKFRFPERWPKIKLPGRASGICEAKIQCVILFKTHLIFANMRVGRAAISGGSEHND